MDNKSLLARIVINPKIMVGKPTIAGTRLTVQLILNLMANGMTIEEILNEYKGLQKEDIFACLLFATKTLDDIAYVPQVAEGR